MTSRSVVPLGPSQSQTQSNSHLHSLSSHHPPHDRSNTRILSVRFNQDANCIAIGTSAGVRIFNCEPFATCYEYIEGAIGLVEMLFCTSLICFVGSGDEANMSPRQLRMFNTKTNKNICELNMVTTVLNVKLNMERVICVLEKSIHIFHTKTMNLLHTIDTIFNPTGICTLSSQSTNSYMCYPASDEKGDIFVYDAINLRVVTYICAHNTPIRCCSLNSGGTLLATCSNKGTVIRVFSIPDGKKLFSFRRGSYPAKVNTINFNKKSDLLVVSSSDSKTVHVFSMRDPPPSTAPLSTSSSSSIISPSSSSPSSPSFLTTSTAAAGAMLKTVANSSAVTLARGGAAAAAAAGVSSALSFLPNLVQDLVEPSRNFAYINLKDPAIPSVCAFGNDDKLMVVTSTGYFSVYSLPLPHIGGQCKLESEYALLDQPNEIVSTKIHELKQTHTHPNATVPNYNQRTTSTHNPTYNYDGSSTIHSQHHHAQARYSSPPIIQDGVYQGGSR